MIPTLAAGGALRVKSIAFKDKSIDKSDATKVNLDGIGKLGNTRPFEINLAIDCKAYVVGWTFWSVYYLADWVRRLWELLEGVRAIAFFLMALEFSSYEDLQGNCMGLCPKLPEKCAELFRISAISSQTVEMAAQHQVEGKNWFGSGKEFSIDEAGKSHPLSERLQTLGRNRLAPDVGEISSPSPVLGSCGSSN
ncbi:hypothetical protein ACH5RR_018324 [Cinchona calisaya]|uniref:Uncharacterized protein n=1 Tax=Cinchona calisaya TaxID=153742 RepID=A0ABD2ZL50_9GENT